jgi:hypothetical protein
MVARRWYTSPSAFWSHCCLTYSYRRRTTPPLIHSLTRRCMIRNDNGRQPRFQSPGAGKRGDLKSFAHESF